MLYVITLGLIYLITGRSPFNPFTLIWPIYVQEMKRGWQGLVLSFGNHSVKKQWEVWIFPHLFFFNTHMGLKKSLVILNNKHTIPVRSLRILIPIYNSAHQLRFKYETPFRTVPLGQSCKQTISFREKVWLFSSLSSPHPPSMLTPLLAPSGV